MPVSISPIASPYHFAKLTGEELCELYRISHVYNESEWAGIERDEHRFLQFILDALEERPEPDPNAKAEPAVPDSFTSKAGQAFIYKEARNLLYAGNDLWAIANVMPEPYNDVMKLQRLIKRTNPRLLRMR